MPVIETPAAIVTLALTTLVCGLIVYSRPSPVAIVHCVAAAHEMSLSGIVLVIWCTRPALVGLNVSTLPPAEIAVHWVVVGQETASRLAPASIVEVTETDG